MKAERRHELKVNSLVWHLQGLPQAIKKYQSQILLVLTLIALVIILINNRIRAARDRLDTARASLSIAEEDLQRVKNITPYPEADFSALMKAREDAYSEGLQQIDQALQKAPNSETAMRAQAFLYKGDLNFEMANYPALPGSATQPSLRPVESDDELLSNAADAYNQVLQNYPNEKFATTAAHFGVAAVAENRAAAGDASQWSIASSAYQAIVDSNAEQAYKTMAQNRMKLLDQLRQPVVFDLSPPTTAPSSRPTTSP